MARYLEIPQVVAGIAATTAATEVVSTVQEVVKTVSYLTISKVCSI